MNGRSLVYITLLTSGCGWGYATTNGKSAGSRPSEASFATLPPTLADLLATRAARDIHCQRSQLSLAAQLEESADHAAYAVDGCGKRVTYFLGTCQIAEGMTLNCPLVMISRMTLDKAETLPATP